MQLEIIQIALGWRGEKYSLKVSDWMRSNLGDTGRQTEAVALLSGALAAARLHVTAPLTGGESRVPLLAGMQLASMSPHHVNSAALQVGRERPAHGEAGTRSGWLPPRGRRAGARRCTCVMFPGRRSARPAPPARPSTWTRQRLSASRKLDSSRGRTT